MIVLKVLWQDQIRRVGFEKPPSGSLTALRNKLTEMLQLEDKSIAISCGEPSSLVRVNSDEALNVLLEEAETRNPPILRVLVQEDTEPTVLPVLPEPEDPKMIPETVVPSPIPAEETATPPSDGEICKCCAGCEVILGSAYYKCLNCLSVEICEECEERSAHAEGKHLLVKLRCPLSELPIKHQMVFKDHVFDGQDRAIARAQKQALREQLEHDRIARKEEQAKKKQEERELKREQERRRKEERERRLKKREESKLKKQEESRQKKRATKQIPKKARHAPKEEPALIPQSVPQPEPVLPNLPSTPLLAGSPVVPRLEGSSLLLCLEAPTTESQVLLSDFHVIPPPAEVEPEVSPVETSPETTPEVLEEPVLEAQPEEVLSATDQKPNVFKQNLERLAEMGFDDREKNIRLLVKHVGDLGTTVEELLRTKSGWFW